MKVLFAHDHKIRYIGGKYYTPGGLPNEVLKRYIDNFGELTLLTRIYEENEEAQSYKEITLPNIRFLNYFDGKISMINSAVCEADVLIARLPSFIGFLAIRVARYHKKPYFVEVVGDPATSYGLYGNLKGKLIAPLMTLIMRHDVKQAPFAIYVSRCFLQNLYPTKGYAVGCPDVYLEMPSQEVIAKRLNRILNQKPNMVTVGLIGSLDVSYRGHETLLLAAAELKNRGIYCDIRFLGGGSKSKWLSLASELDIKDMLTFTGTLPSGEPVFNWIDNIDILIMPTQQETLGRAIIEAMSRGCPVIGSIETAIGEQIGSDCLCKAKDYLSIADMVEKMINDRDYMKYCAQENFFRSFKYINSQTDKIRNAFFDYFLKSTDIGRQE